jgi:hypothetical protein
MSNDKDFEIDEDGSSLRNLNEDERKLFFERKDFSIFELFRKYNIPTLGKKIFEWHIKIGIKTRVHFFIDKDNSKIYIGHCGEHLPI